MKPFDNTYIEKLHVRNDTEVRLQGGYTNEFEGKGEGQSVIKNLEPTSKKIFVEVVGNVHGKENNERSEDV